jgi:uncharacterized protein (TIRG00374 family)
VLISAVALLAALQDVHWHEVRLALERADYFLIGVAAVILLFAILLRAMRWLVLLQPLPRTGVGQLFGALNVAYFINNVLPLQMGDIGRAYLVSEIAGISATRALSTVVVERVADVLTLLFILLCLAPFIDIPGWARAPSIAFAVGFSSLAVGLILASLRRDFVLRLVERLTRLAPASSRPKLQSMASSAIEGFAALTKPGLALRLLAYSAVIWLTTGLVVYTGMQALHLGLGYDAALFVLIATTFGFFVPSSPGAFGVYHAIAIGTLTGVFDIEKNAAVTYALVVHLVFYLPPMVIGPAFLWQERELWLRRPSVLNKLAELRGATTVAQPE